MPPAPAPAGTADASPTASPATTPAATSAASPAARPAGPGRHRKEGGARTRTELMDVAEELFAASGVEGVSVRSINAAAEVAPASVHYHFGDRDGLLRAVIARRGEAVVARQTERLTALEQRRRRPTAEEVVRLLADPFFELLADDPVGGCRWLTILANLVAADDERVYLGVGPGSVQERINRCAASAYPHQPVEVMAARWRMATTSLLQLIAGEAARSGSTGMAPDEADAIVRFVASGLDGVCRVR